MTFSFGEMFRMTVFGESHGECVGVSVEGVPPGTEIDTKAIQKELDRRKPGKSTLTTGRKEDDALEILGGVFEGKATGAPIVMAVRNKDVDSSYYEEIRDTPRPGHADLTAKVKYGGLSDHRGGGTFSGRMTAAFVMAGALAKQVLKKEKIGITARITGIGKAKTEKEMEEEVLGAKKDGDSVGGTVECTVTGVPAGIGEPLFDSVESVLSHAVFSVPGVKGVEFGSGFGSATMRGSVHNDPFVIRGGKIATETNNSGGVLGGITNGMPVVFRAALKPAASIAKTQKTVDVSKLKETEINVRGRHDPCIALRAVPVIEAVCAVSILDLIMRSEKWKK